MIDIVIPLRTDLIPTANHELKYALRSIETYLGNAGKIFIIGSCPEWLNLQTVEYIPYHEKNWFTQLTRNIHEKLKIACHHHKVSDNFLYFNDDHFLLDYADAAQYPLYHGGAEFGGKGQYKKATVPDTIAILKSAGYADPIYNYDVHTPILINKRAYLETLGTLDWKKDYGYCIKTCYAYLTGLQSEGVPFADLKIHESPKTVEELESLLKDRHIFSTGEKAFKMLRDENGGNIPNSIVRFMEETYPKKSKYEI
jgi:hypothetical protein